MEKNKLDTILDFLHRARKLKNEMRHSWEKDGRQESVADHTWRLSLMAILLAPELKTKVDLEKVLKMVIIHDLPEIEAGDYFAQDYEYDKILFEKKIADEIKGAEKIKNELNSTVGDEIYALWHEFEENKTPEALFAQALDRLEVRIEHNEDPLDTWSDTEFPRAFYRANKYCTFDETLAELNKKIQAESENKLERSGMDVEEIKQTAYELEEEYK